MTRELEQFFQESQEPTSQLEELAEATEHIQKISAEFRLDPFPIHFEVVPAQKIYEIGSYGLPVRFSHWTHGRIFRQLRTEYEWGLSHIYEVVINSNPSLAYLHEGNEPIANKMVIAHVVGHVDFFKNNHLFVSTRKDMPHAAAVSSEKIREYEFKNGEVPVENFLDHVLSITEHIDPDPRNFYRPSVKEQIAKWKEEQERRRKKTKPVSEFDDLFEQEKKEEIVDTKVKIPLDPERDVLGFIRDYAPYLEDWQRDCIDIVRMESFYFRPQARTKIMNEGWASYWHKRIMRMMGERGLLSDYEQTEWVRMHTGVAQPSRDPRRINPYYLGMKMFEYLEDYYNGNLTDEEKRWLAEEKIPVFPKYFGPFEESPALFKLREIMATEDDQSFIRNHFDKIVADRLNMFIYDREEIGDEIIYTVKDKSWKLIRDQLVQSKNNAGYPYVVVEDGDYARKQELYLKHIFDGLELDLVYLEKTLPHIFALWQKPVYIETVVEGKPTLFSFSGEKVEKKVL